MSQVNSVEAADDYQQDSQKPNGFLKRFFNSAADDIEKQVNLTQYVDRVKNVSNRTTTFLNHLIKDNQFMYKLSDQDIEITRSDIKAIRLKEKLVVDAINPSLSAGSVIDIDEEIHSLENIRDEIISQYIKSIKSLTSLVNEKHEAIHGGIREFNDYNFIELVADFDKKTSDLKQSKSHCNNTLKLRVGDHFGYNLQLTIKGSFSDTSTFENLQIKEGIQSHDFFYPVNYSMIIMGNILPDINFIKGHLSRSKVLNVSKIVSVNIQNDIYEELENILPCTDSLKQELVSSMRSIVEIEDFLTASVGCYRQEEYLDLDTDRLVSDIDDKIRNFKVLLGKQSERINPTNTDLGTNYPDVSQTNYISIHSIIYRRFVILMEKLEILKEIYTRQSASLHAFNLDVMKQVL